MRSTERISAMADIENPEIDEGHLPPVSDVQPFSATHVSSGDGNELQDATISKPLELDLCLATFFVEAISSIGTPNQWRWEALLGIADFGNSPDGPDIEGLMSMLTDTPLHNTAVRQNMTSSIAEVNTIYLRIDARKNVKARLQLMSWTSANNLRSKLERQAAMLCNLSNAHYYLKRCKTGDDCRLKWVSVDVLRLWLGQEFVRNVLLPDGSNDYFREHLALEDNEIEKILRGEFLATLALCGETAIALQHVNFLRRLEIYIFVTAENSRTDLKINHGHGRLIPMSQKEMTKILIYAHGIQREKEENLDSLGDDYTLPLFTRDELQELKHNQISDPFSSEDWDILILRSQKKVLQRRKKFEKKIVKVVRDPFGTVTKGNYGRLFLGIVLIFTVIAVIAVTYQKNPVRREYDFERFVDAFQIGTILIAVITILVKAISPDSSVLRNSILGRKLISEFKQVRQYCKVPTQREFCFLLALRERNFRWLSEENLSFVSGSLTGEIRNNDEMQLYELARMGFTIEGGYVFNPYVGKYFKINGDSMSGGHLRPVDSKEIKTFDSPEELLQERLPCSYIIR